MPQSVVVNGATYRYNEVSTGTRRGINMYRQGVAGDVHQYMFNPNPHDDRAYNKNQPKFYLDAATAIATAGTTPPNNGPPFGSQVTVFNVTYTLTDR